MECVLQQGSFRDLGLNPVQNGDVSAFVSDDSFVDQLLNLSAENTLDDVDDDHSTASLLSPLPALLQPPSAVAEEDDDFGSLLALPEEEADLEWLSHFVEDSFSQFCHASGIAHTARPMPENIRPPAVLPRSRRSKRLRPSAVRSWTLTPPPISSSLTESTTSSSPSSSATSPPYCPTTLSTPLAFPDPNSKKKKARSMPGSSSAASRRCCHCGTQKTPQWRAGPMGSKTLCNACGVRFKTGRLLPEYRPACSPTFSSVLHSNSHRKVLEMRRNKESTGPTEPGL
ncbi:hypothetical protein V2J09_009504 [Rumex salicifolius]